MPFKFTSRKSKERTSKRYPGEFIQQAKNGDKGPTGKLVKY
jgi:hypothetical protein